MKFVIAVLACAICLTIIPVSSVSANHTGRYTVTAKTGVRMRARPTTESRIIRIVPYGARVSVLTHYGSWLKFTYGGNTGWTRQEFLTKGTFITSGPAVVHRSLCYSNTFGAVVCAEQWVADNIAAAASYYGIGYDTMMALAACESDFDYGLVWWSGATGLFQWMPSTWAWIGQGSIWSVHDQAWSTAWALANGYASHWECWNRI